MNTHIRAPFTIGHLPALPRETAISRAFSALLPILSDYIRAERDLEDIAFSLDPAYMAWHREADEAQDRLIDVLRALRSLPVETIEDLPLRRMALLVHAMRDEGGNARRLYHEMEAAFLTRFHVPGSGPTELHRNLLLAWARPLVAALVALPLFDPDPGQDEARTMSCSC